MALPDLVRNLATALLGAVAPTQGSTTALSSTQLGAMGKLIGPLPVADLLALIEGRGTIDTDLDLAAQAAAIVAAAFPPAAITAKEIEYGLEALRFLLDAAGVGATPIKIEPGQNPLNGGWAGARGHVY